MTFLVTDCPRCNSKHVTFDIKSYNLLAVEYDWKHFLEVYCECRACRKGSILRLAQNERDKTGALANIIAGSVNLDVSLDRWFLRVGHVSAKDEAQIPPPEYLPANVDRAFREGSTCMAVCCYNASAAMFRLCIDLATKPLLLDGSEGAQPNEKTKRDLGLRLQWLFANGRLPEPLRDLAACIREDANDGAHVGNLSAEDAADVADFTFIMLERLFTEPERVRQAAKRRVERRTPK